MSEQNDEQSNGLTLPNSITRSLRVPIETDKKVRACAKELKFAKVTPVYLHLIGLGIRAHEYHLEMKAHPEREKEIREEFGKLLDEKTIFDQAGSLSDSQIEGIKMALEMEREKRREKRR